MEGESGRLFWKLAKPAAPGALSQRETSLLLSGKGSGFGMTLFTTLNTAVFAPIPIARVRSIVAVRPGDRTIAAAPA